MRRQIIAFVSALVTWMVVASLLNRVLRLALPGYTAAEPMMAFSLSMQWARLMIGALASLSAGYVIARLAPEGRRLAIVFGVVLLALFVPDHYRLWSRFPIWYHLAFLLTILPLVAAGAQLGAPRTSMTEQSQ